MMKIREVANPAKIQLQKEKKKNKTTNKDKLKVYRPSVKDDEIPFAEVSVGMQNILRELQERLGGFADVSTSSTKNKSNLKTKIKIIEKSTGPEDIDSQEKSQSSEFDSKAEHVASHNSCQQPNPTTPSNQLLDKSKSKKSLNFGPLRVIKLYKNTSSLKFGHSRLHNPKKINSSSTSVYFENDVFKKLKHTAECAIRERKTFTVSGHYNTIRNALVARGWVEKIKMSYRSYEKDLLKQLLMIPIPDLMAGVNDRKNGNLYRRVILSKLLVNHQVDFYWDHNNDCFRTCPDNVKLTIFNRFKKGIFSYTSKQGLCEAMKSAYWFQRPGIASVKYPRAYSLLNVDNPKDFVDDFKLTACMSLIKYVVYCVEVRNNRKILSSNGKVPTTTFKFAIDELKKKLRILNHDDIDHQIVDAETDKWNNFLENFFRVVHIGLKFKQDGTITLNEMVESAKPIIAELKEFWPSFDIDGMFNIWILKPVNSCRGQGIHLCRTLQYILNIIRTNTRRRYVIQKYIERPLLIYNTKFDIRQWFLISSSNPLTMWMYKDCYIRFSSQIYSLHRLNESIHLTNNSIQSKYKNCTSRHSDLPSCNMWDSKQFQEYLASIGKPDVFRDLIYPKMKEAITASILMNQDTLDTRKNCFELYGSDFMITEDFQPWLIEINARPALFASTPVTGKLCPLVLEDLIKVIIDHRRNANAGTGGFELLYKEAHCVLPPIKTATLQLQGRQLECSYFCNSQDRYHLNKTFYMGQQKFKQAADDIKKALHILLQLVQNECLRKKISNYTSVGTNAPDSSKDIDRPEEYLIEAPFNIKQSKSDSDIEKCTSISALPNKSIFEHIIQSIRNLAKAYQEYQTSCSTKM